MASRARMWLGAMLAVGLLAGCEEDTGGESEGSTTGGGETGNTTDDPTTTSPGTSSDTAPDDCIAGQEDCVCLDGGCVGVLQCIESECKRPPSIEIDEDAEALAGMRFPLEADVAADAFGWEQVSGPSANLDGVDQTLLLVDIPADAAPGDVLTFRFTATQNTIEDSREVSITVLEAQFQDALPEINDPAQLGTASGLAFAMNQMWVASSEGFVSTFNEEGLFNQSYPAGMSPAGIRPGRMQMGDDNIDVMYFADPTAEILRVMFQVTGEVQTVTDQAEDATPIGAVADVVTRGNDGDLVFANPTTGQIFIYLWEEGVTRLLTDSVGTTPDALAFGPEQAVLYVGTVGKVWRLPIDAQEDTAGEPTLYLDLGDELDPLNRVDGLVFDAVGNLWVSTPETGTLHLSRYTAGEQSEVHNSWTPNGDVAAPADLALGGPVLYYTDFATGRVGSVRTGLGRDNN